MNTITDWLWKNTYKVVFIFLFLWIIIWLSFDNIKTFISSIYNYPKITWWLQALGWIGSLIIAYIAYKISTKFNTFTENQTKIALEEFRPRIVASWEWKLHIKNDWDFEGSELSYYIKEIDKKWCIVKIRQIEEWIVLSKTCTYPLDLWVSINYFSIIIKYTNYSSWVKYLYWFNYKDWKDVINIWDSYSKESSNTTLKSPIEKKEYLKIFKIFSLENQLIKKIDVEKEFSNFILRN